jgi:hypothetical protein
MAGLVRETSGQAGGAAYVHLYDQQRQVSIGDWFVYGCWMRPAAGLSILRDLLTLGSGPINPGNIRAWFNSTDQPGASPAFTAYSYRDGAYVPVVHAAKLTAFSDGQTTGGNIQMALDLRIAHDGDAYAAFPFLLHIPAGQMSDAEVIRLKRTIKALPPGAQTPGRVSLLPHQGIGFRDASYRSGPSDPTAADIATGASQLWLNTGNGELRLWANVGGVMRKSAALI